MATDDVSDFPTREYLRSVPTYSADTRINELVGSLIRNFCKLENALAVLNRHIMTVPYLRARGFGDYADPGSPSFANTYEEVDRADYTTVKIKDAAEARGQAFISLCRQLLPDDFSDRLDLWFVVFDSTRLVRNRIAHLPSQTNHFTMPLSLTIDNSEQVCSWLDSDRSAKRPPSKFIYSEESLSNIIADIAWLAAHAGSYAHAPRAGEKKHPIKPPRKTIRRD